MEVIYLTMTMALGTMSVCLTVLVLNLHHRDAERPVPRWARVLVLRYLAKLLCVRARKPKTMAANLDLVIPDAEDAASATDIKDGLRHVSDYYSRYLFIYFSHKNVRNTHRETRKLYAIRNGTESDSEIKVKRTKKYNIQTLTNEDNLNTFFQF